MPDGYVILDDQIAPSVRYYKNPVALIEAHTPEDIHAAFTALEQYHADGYFIAGYIAYETGYVLEPSLLHLMPEHRPGPLLQFGVFKSYDTPEDLSPPSSKIPPLTLKPNWCEADYEDRFKSVIAYITAGDVYQINLTFPLHGKYDGDARDLYAALRHRQAGRYGGIISLGGPDIISLSPELFFKKTDANMMMHPMKGTVRRQSDPVQDAALRDAMREDAKSQAENLMIVDLLRNDLSRIATKGSVKVPELFALETYPTLHQMTSKVRAELRDGLSFTDIFKSLFPCGSVTGAPKIRAMEIIHELETTPRGAYCGSLGYIDPNGDACFNVAIRTLTLDGQKLTYNVGSGVVLDSQAKDEYAECLLKAKVVAAPGPDLIETFHWEPNTGPVRIERHLTRLTKSANALGYPCDLGAIKEDICHIKSTCALRVRLSLSELGHVHIETTPFQPASQPWTVSLCAPPLTPEVQETRHKVSERDFYDGQRRRIQALTKCDEVLFFNDREELCEGSFTSVFLEIDGELYTPHLSSGLLPGILREELVETGQAQERVLAQADFKRADKLYVGNSLRGLIPVTLISPERF